MSKKRKWILTTVAVAAVILAGGGYAWGRLGYSGFGMMGGFGTGSGMMGFSTSNISSSGERLPPDRVEAELENFLLSYYDNSFYIEEVMEFSNNYYAQIGHKDEETLAFELLIDPYSGSISEEPGPNMMWNRSYGQMRWRFWNKNRKMSVSEPEAVTAAQEYLDRYQPGSKAEPHADKFNGYYTIHTVNKKGEVTGMLSVNGYNSRVWYHNWHGANLAVLSSGTLSEEDNEEY
ncbi:MAG: hypothetical protein L3J12_03480 [Spirochaetales bacterium]|nr:hypothetical protein [Spirochaetales bacterium]